MNNLYVGIFCLIFGIFLSIVGVYSLRNQRADGLWSLIVGISLLSFSIYQFVVYFKTKN